MKRRKVCRQIFSAAMSAALVLSSVNLPLTVRAGTDLGSIPEAVFVEIPQASGTVYHVDSQNGNDTTGDGSLDKPFKSLSKVNEITLQPGDGISLKKGSIFDNQQLAPKGRGTEADPIVIDSYGDSGKMPVINAGGFRRNGKTNEDGTPAYDGHKSAVLIENMEYVYVTGLEVTNDDAFNETSAANDPNNAKDGSDDVFPRRLGIHVTIDERAADTFKGAGDENRVYRGIVIDGCYVHDVDGNENRGVNKVDGGIGVETIFSSKARVYPYFDGVTIQRNRIDQCDRTGIKAIRISDLDNFRHNNPANSDYDPNNDADNNGANDNSRYSNIRFHDQAQRGLRIVGNYLSDIGGDGILVCESKGAVVEHNVLNGQCMRARGANAGIWSWNSFDTLFRYNESFRGPVYNQDGCSYDSDYNSAGTIFEYNYSHDTLMGFMLLMGGNDTDIVRYNLSQNDGVAWRHGAGGSKSESYIYNNVFYYDGADWVFNHSNGNGVGMGTANNWGMYNNIYYNYNPDSVSRWNYKADAAANWGNLKMGGNLVYEAGGIHSESELPGSIQADPLFVTPGGAASAAVSDDGMHAQSDWESLKAYALKSNSPAIGSGVYVNVVPRATGDNVGCWDSTSDRNARTDFFGNPLYNGAPDIGIFEMPGESAKEYPVEKNGSYKIYDQNTKTYLIRDGNGLVADKSGEVFVMENSGAGYKIRTWDTENNTYLYLKAEGANVEWTDTNPTIWTVKDMKNGLHQILSGDSGIVVENDGTISVGSNPAAFNLQLEEHSKSYNAGGGELDGFSADQAYDGDKKLSGHTGTPEILTAGRDGVYGTGLTGDTVEYKVYASNVAHNLKLYVSEMESATGRTFDVLVNGELVRERYTLSGDTDVIELGSVYPVGGVITVKLQSAYSAAADQMTNPILNGIQADAAAMSEVNMRLDAGNTDTQNMGNHDGLYQDAEFPENGSGWYVNGDTATSVTNSGLAGDKPNPDAGMGTALKSGRTGSDFGYKFKTAPGLYRVKLYFNDTSTDQFTPGTFDILVNGETVKSGFTIPEKNKAYAVVTTAQSKNGLIDISLKATDGEAIVNAVIVEPYQEAAGENLAVGKNVTASGPEQASMKAEFAIDNDQTTRYSSGQGSGQYFQVDLAKKYMVDTVMVDWTPGSYATTYRVETAVPSDGALEWKTAKTVRDAYPGLNLVQFDPVEAQYVRIVSEANANMWGMSMTEFGVYGEMITGSPAVQTATEALENNQYQVAVSLENIFNKYRNTTVSYTYDPAHITLNTELVSINETALLSSAEPSVTDNEDGTRTVGFVYGLKDQNAFKSLAEMMKVIFTADEQASRTPVSIQVSFSNAEGHITDLEKTVTYVPNNFTYLDLQTLIRTAEEKLAQAVVGVKPGEYAREVVDALQTAVTEAGKTADGQESAVYEKAYVALEAAIKTFEMSVNVNQYKTFHADYQMGDTADYTYTNGSGKVENGALNISLNTNGIARSNALALSEGTLYARFETDSIGDQTLFSAGNIRVGYESPTGWFWDSENASPGYGTINGTKDFTADKEHELILEFKVNENNKYDIHLIVDGVDKGTVKNKNYNVEAGGFSFQTRRAGHNLKIKEVYYTNAPQHTITVSAGANGKIYGFESETGTKKAAVYGEADKTFRFVPNEGYMVDTVTVDGTPVKVEGSTYTFEYLMADHTLDVTFKEADYNIQELRDLITQAESFGADGYTAASYQKLQDAIAAATGQLDQIFDKDSLEKAKAELQKAIDELENLVLTSLVLDTENVKKVYLVDETLDLTGLVVKAVYQDSSEKVLNGDQYEISGFTSQQAGPVRITVTYKEGEITKTAFFDVTVQVSADKEALSLAVLMAKRLEEGKDGFTAASWQKVETALTEAEALMEDPYAAQADVNRVFGELLDACTSLESGIAKAALKAVIDSTEALLADENLERLYTSDSIQVLKNALDEAKTVYETTTEETPDGQKKINEATNKLIEASTQLLDRNFTALDTLIAKVEKMLEEKDKYTTSTADALEMALNEAKIVAGKDTATGDEIRKAHLDLTEAVTGLEYRGNKAELENAIKTAEKMLSEKDRYVSSTLAGLEAVLNSAKDVFESNDVNQDTVDEAAAALAVECAKARLLGDVNLDGTVDSADSAELLRYCVDLISLTEEQLQAADVNTDDSQDTADASLILQYASEKIDRF